MYHSHSPPTKTHPHSHCRFHSHRGLHATAALHPARPSTRGAPHPQAPDAQSRAGRQGTRTRRGRSHYRRLCPEWCEGTSDARRRTPVVVVCVCVCVVVVYVCVSVAVSVGVCVRVYSLRVAKSVLPVRVVYSAVPVRVCESDTYVRASLGVNVRVYVYSLGVHVPVPRVPVGVYVPVLVSVPVGVHVPVPVLVPVGVYALLHASLGAPLLTPLGARLGRRSHVWNIPNRRHENRAPAPHTPGTPSAPRTVDGQDRPDTLRARDPAPGVTRAVLGVRIACRGTGGRLCGRRAVHGFPKHTIRISM
ncbi:hypothetical protein B0H11DRAFT_195468 [Mycena galericulata]|nr:hypothetical protein B0H11DRAFT_195468 [Mycena galericulata]